MELLRLLKRTASYWLLETDEVAKMLADFDPEDTLPYPVSVVVALTYVPS